MTKTVIRREKIVVIEDEPDIREVIEHNLRREGYQVFCTPDGEAGWDLVRQKAPDLILLDLMLPGLDGIELCRRLKADPLTSEIPVIMVTAKGEESDVVLGLGVGADDYVCKPFSPRELLARVRAVLRRAGPALAADATRDRIMRQGLSIDRLKHEVSIDGHPVPFTATEFRLLYCLASHPGRVFTRDQLLSRVIGESVAVIDRNIDVHVRAVRKKLGPYRELLETVRGVGYRFRDERA